MTQYFHTQYIEKKRCIGCMACMRACPAEAIRVKSGKAKILEDRCIDCGECIRSCPNNAVVPLTDSFTELKRFKYTIALPSPVLYGQFERDILPEQILRGLKKIGFDDVYDVAYMCEAVSLAIQKYLRDYHGPTPLLSGFCPAIVRLIQVRFPALAELVIPIDTPKELLARKIKESKAEELGLKKEEIGLIYITPCPAKMIAIKHPPRKPKSYLDGAISIADIYSSLLAAVSNMDEREPKPPFLHKSSGLGIGWALVGGEAQSLRAENRLAVSGVNNVIKIFEDIESGRLRDIEYVECRSCWQGCIGGSLTVDTLYASHNKIIKLVEMYGKEPKYDSAEVADMYQKRYFFLDRKLASRPIPPLDKDVAKAIEKMRQKQRIYQSLPKIDCGACGAPNCMAFAEDVVQGQADISDCIFKLQKKFRDLTKELLHFVERTPLTMMTEEEK